MLPSLVSLGRELDSAVRAAAPRWTLRIKTRKRGKAVGKFFMVLQAGSFTTFFLIPPVSAVPSFMGLSGP